MDEERKVQDSLLRKLIENHEGRRKFVYTDTTGHLTIGVGWNLDANGLPESIIDALLDYSIDVAKGDLDKLIPWWKDLDEVRQAALIDLCFNLGYSRLAQFKNGTLELIRQGKYVEAGNMLKKSLWYKQVKRRGVRIVSMIQTGEYP